MQNQIDVGKTKPLSELENFFSTGLRLTKGAHLYWQQFVRPGDFVIDATAGNGMDTLWLSKAVGPSGKVLSIDIQETAIESARDLISVSLPADLVENVEFSVSCHSNENLWQGSPKLVCFNLGYLPGADKSLITKPETTLSALRSALRIVKPGGLVSVMTYIAHEGGLAEHEAVTKLLATLPTQDWTVMSNHIINRPTSPVLTLASKRLGLDQKSLRDT